jgi:hypothetical protein
MKLKVQTYHNQHAIQFMGYEIVYFLVRTRTNQHKHDTPTQIRFRTPARTRQRPRKKRTHLQEMATHILRALWGILDILC